jgi:chaperonin GroES
MHVTPLHDRILVRRLEEGEQKIGGIIIPDSATEKPQHGQVIAVGKGRLNDEGQRIAVAIKAGDRILFGKYAQEITLAGETYLILREDEVLAVLGGGGTKRITTTPKQNKRTRPAAKKTTRLKKGKKKTTKK